MTELEKAIRTLQEIPATNNSVDELKAALARYPAWLKEIAHKEVSYQVDSQGAELSPYGYLREQVKACGHIALVLEILHRHGWDVHPIPDQEKSG